MTEAHPRPPGPSGADVCVVGGGPAGLAAALLAARTGRSVVLLESSPRLGGMAASTVVAGQRVDLGSHRLHPSASPAARSLLDELLGDDLQVRPRHGRLRLGDRWVGFPLRTGDLLRSVPPGFAARAGVDVLTGPLRRPRADTYAEVVRVGLGPAVLAHFHGPYARKLWGRAPEELAGELARRRISVRSGGALLAKLRRSARPGGRTFLYPRLGFGQIVDRLAEAAVDAGVQIRTSTPVTAVSPDPAQPSVGTAGGGAVTAARVLWTAPLPLLSSLAGGPSAHLEHRGVVLVYLALGRDRWSEWDAHYVPDLDVAFARLSEPKRYRDGPDPAGRTVLCAEVPATPGDPTWDRSDADLAALVLDGMARCGLDVPDHRDVVEVVTHRLPAVYPVVTPSSVPGLEAVRRWADGIPGVTVLGRQGLFVADNIHHVLDMAIAAAGCLADPWDAAGWRAARTRFDAHVVED